MSIESYKYLLSGKNPNHTLKIKKCDYFNHFLEFTGIKIKESKNKNTSFKRKKSDLIANYLYQ